ncbi:MAG: hypothetical protein ABL921_23625 [Pirellula sp.]
MQNDLNRDMRFVHHPLAMKQIHSSRFGLTIIEVMIATTITLLMMLALAQGFKAMSDTVSEGRSKLTLNDELRSLSALLRSDLEGRTTNSESPQSYLTSEGYFKYYDGPLSDSSATLFNYTPALDSTVEQRLTASRWGDVDDILMFTAKAKPGQVFRGKIPLALMLIDKINDQAAMGANWAPDANNTPGFAGWEAAWRTDVTISSEYAEIVWFMMPLNENNSIDPNTPDNMVMDVAPGADHVGYDTGAEDGIPDPDGMPDRIALCRRVLLIRPDLDITPTPVMYSSGIVAAGTATGDFLTMQPRQPNASAPITFRFMMQYPYQRCDLSLRPHLVTSPSGSVVSIKTNSVEELQLPENRFAHYTFPIAPNGTPIGTTLPLLALSSEANALQYLALTNPSFSNIGLNPSSATLYDRGFLPSCFMRTKVVGPAGGPFTNPPLLEEIVVSNVVAFDAKGYDSSVKQLASPGRDGLWGDVVADPPSTAQELQQARALAGSSGTDDLTLVPSDPGYAVQLARLAGGATTEMVSEAGAFVDVGWGSKLFNQSHRLAVQAPSGTRPTPIRLSQLAANQQSVIAKFFPSSLSLFDVGTNGLMPSTAIRNSGAGFVNTSLFQSYQPCFDTFTNAYEFDGEAILRTSAGLVWQNGLRRFGANVTIGGPDPLSLGNGPWADTSVNPPVNYDRDVISLIPYKMPSIQVTIRVQDATAGTLQQISVVQDLN